MTHITEQHGYTRHHSDILTDLSALIRALGMGKDGIVEATDMRRSFIERLPAFDSGYMYPWYCLLVALSSDVLRGLTGGTTFFALIAEDVVNVLNRARYAQLLFSKEEATDPFGPGVGEFLDQARAMFVQLCWYLTDPESYEDFSFEDRGKLKVMLDAIGSDDRCAESCASIYYKLFETLCAGQPEPSGIIEMITYVELGEEWVEAK